MYIARYSNATEPECGPQYTKHETEFHLRINSLDFLSDVHYTFAVKTLCPVWECP